MTDKFTSFRQHFGEVIASVQRYGFFVRASEFHDQSVEKLLELKKECIERKNEAIAINNEDEANACLCFEYITETLIKEFEFYIKLKQDDPDAAWDHLVNAQLAAANAVKSHQFGSILEKYVSKLYILEKALFPQMAFFSTGFIVKKSECSVCNKDYSTCDHIKGKPYMGQLCGRIITEAELREVSVVDEPSNKHCRVTSFTEGEVTCNALTHRVMKEKE